MSKEIAIKSPTELKVYTNPENRGAVESITASDVQVPVLMLMQSNSTFVQEDDDINSGDFLHSISKEVWGKKDKSPVEIVVFDMFKTQIVSDVSGKTKKWIETLPWKADMLLDPYEEEVKGMMVRRELCFNYCFFRASEIREKKGPDGKLVYTSSPAIVKFKGGSLKNGKRLNQTFVDFDEKFDAPCWAKTFLLTANLDDKDGNKYWAYDFSIGEDAQKEQQFVAEKLFLQMKEARRTNTLNVVDAEETEEFVNKTTGEVC